MARKRANLSDLLNDLTFKVIFNKFKLITLNAFEWEGLPSGILERHIERELFDRGSVVFFRDPRMSYMCLPATESGNVNVYGDPTAYHVSGFNYRRTLNARDCVVIENNKLRIPTYDFIIMYANKIAEAERTMDVNVKANKTPVVVLCDDKDVLSFKRMFQMVDGNAPAVFADRSMNIDNMTALDLKARFLGNELMDYKHSVENELLTFLGINNTPVDKKERLITDEANSNNQLIESFFDLQLEARERACEAINEMYNLNVTVKKREAVENPVGNVESEVDGDDE